MRLNHNIASLDIYSTYSKNLNKQSKALQRISSGLKVSSSADNAGAMAQSEKIRMQIRGLQMAGRNAQDGVSMLQTAEGGLDNVTSMLQRVRELRVQGNNGTYNSGDEANINTEITQLMDGIKGITDNTEFNDLKLLNDPDVTDNNYPKTISMPIGANVGEKVDIPVFNINQLDVDTSDLDSIDSAINTILSIRSKYGALENRFESGLNNANEISDKMDEADSNLRDADIAEEMMEYSKDNILTQAGNAMMVQSDKFPQDILQILQNVKSR